MNSSQCGVPIYVISCTGGDSYQTQLDMLESLSFHPHIMIATIGRLLNLCGLDSLSSSRRMKKGCTFILCYKLYNTKTLLLKSYNEDLILLMYIYIYIYIYIFFFFNLL